MKNVASERQTGPCVNGREPLEWQANLFLMIRAC